MQDIHSLRQDPSVFTGLQPVPNRKVSRWSESTHDSSATDATGVTSISILPGQNNSSSPRSFHARPSRQLTVDVPVEQDTAEYAEWRHTIVRSRGSEDSQASCGPVTPTDDVDQPVLISLPSKGVLDTHLSTPRRAPVPPTLTTIQPLQSRQLPPFTESDRPLSLTQSMMRSLSGRKKEMNVSHPFEVRSLLGTSDAAKC